ncbi:hypothetical protein D0Z07_2376 [Hyphodiscus hymeniophilus]|uniref:Uncharacterized protein n=1 Tax=Hyphodiscus hymeniophilus TaxID=353542 RepID=A0A9P7AYL0_9HELO|nr:hypothetical protein D0Z07_2376 [Hyphodiscus hymeniophilus]
MSRHTGSARHRTHGSRTQDQSPEELVEQVKSIVTLLYEVVSSRPHEWEAYVPSARSAMTALDRLRFFRDPARFAEQVWILQGLQDFAYHDADSGCIRDIAEYCQASWLRILRNYPENVETLTGLGRNWLQRAQATLARIHREEGDSSSGGSGGSGGQTGNSLDVDCDWKSEDDSNYIKATLSADPRRQGPLYVEARGYLQPAVDFYTRAIQSADALGSTTGDLLAAAAESQMSLGNVSGTPADERFFAQAIRYLRRAQALPGYTLSVYLGQYLNDYGRYVS